MPPIALSSLHPLPWSSRSWLRFSAARRPRRRNWRDSPGDPPFRRSLAASGVVPGTLEELALVAGGRRRRCATCCGPSPRRSISIVRVRDGDRFYVRYERTFSLDDTPIDGGRVLWAELKLSAGKRTIALHRFRPAGTAMFPLAGQRPATGCTDAAPAALELRPVVGVRPQGRSARPAADGAADAVAATGPMAARRSGKGPLASACRRD